MRPLPLALLVLLAACRTGTETPQPVAMTEESLGHYCQMNLLEHPGPKAQVHLKDMLGPLFFSQVRDAIAYQRMPEQAAEITAIYVSDMAAAPGWDDPGADNWMALSDAVFVTGSDRDGGMGAPEVVPFSDPQAAEDFIRAHGGQAVRLDEIPDAELLAARDKPVQTGPAQTEPAPIVDDAEPDYAARLRALSTAGKDAK